MWIQVRTMDGKVAHSVGSLSRLTKVEELREKIQELFHVEPGRQRLFYRGKQVRPPCRLPAAQQAPLFLSRPGFAPPPPAHSDPRPPAPGPPIRSRFVSPQKTPMPEPGTKARLPDGHTGQAAGTGVCSIRASHAPFSFDCV